MSKLASFPEEIKIKLQVDATQLDDVLGKLERLIELQQKSVCHIN